MEKVYSIRAASEELGVETHTLRRLCNAGLIPHVRRARNGYRVLTTAQVDLARVLLDMKQAGFTSAEVRQYARLSRQGDAALSARVAMLTTRKRQLWQEITERQQAIDFIERQEELFQQRLVEQKDNSAAAKL